MNDFENACAEIEKDADFGSPCENVIEFLRNQKEATVSFTQSKYMTKIRKLAEKFPDKVKIYSDKMGTLVAHIPVSAIRITISDSKPRIMTEEEKERHREVLRRAREKQKSLRHGRNST